MRLALVFLGSLSLVACDGGEDTDTSDTMEESDSEMESESESGDPSYMLQGTVMNSVSGAAVADACIALIDPVAALSGGAEPFATGMTDSNGAYVIEGIVDAPENAIFAMVDNCEDDTAIMSTITPVPESAYADFEDGDVVDADLLSMDAATIGGIQSSLVAVGYTGDDVSTAGGIFMNVVDNTGAAVADAVIDCGSCTGVGFYYMDANPADGLFGAGTTANTATQAGVGVSFITGLGVSTLNVTHSSLTFSGQLYAGFPGSVVLGQLAAQ